MSARRKLEARIVSMDLLEHAIAERKAGRLGDAELAAINLGTADLLETEGVEPLSRPRLPDAD